MNSRYQYTGIKKTILVKSKKVIIEFYTSFNPHDKNVVSYLIKSHRMEVNTLNLTLSSFNYYLNYFYEIFKIAIGKLCMKYYDTISTSVKFNIMLKLSPDFSGKYHKDISTTSNIYISINFLIFLSTFNGTSQIFEKTEHVKIYNLTLVELYSILEHEYIHHLDREFIESQNKYLPQYERWEKHGRISKNSLYLFLWFYTIRLEAITTFTAEYVGFRKMKIDIGIFRDFREIINRLIGEKHNRKIEGSTSSLNYRVGVLLTNIIAIYMLVKEGKEDKLFLNSESNHPILPRGFRPFKDNFRKYWKFLKSFSVYYGIPPKF